MFTSVAFIPLVSNIFFKSRFGVKVGPPFFPTPSAVTVATEPTVCTIAIFNAHLDDPPNETTVHMLALTNGIGCFSLGIQNAPLLSKDIGIPPLSSTNCWLSRLNQRLYHSSASPLRCFSHISKASGFL